MLTFFFGLMIGALLVYKYFVKGQTPEVISFPDSKGPCRYLLEKGRCTPRVGSYCDFSHRESGYYKIFKLITEAERTIDICMYRLYFPGIIEKLIQLKKVNVRIRVISDGSCESQKIGPEEGDSYQNLLRLAQEGIEVKLRKDPAGSRGLMHNKFLIIDSSHLIHGSANWSLNAISSNNEMIVIHHDRSTINAFQRQFDKLFGTGQFTALKASNKKNVLSSLNNWGLNNLDYPILTKD